MSFQNIIYERMGQIAYITLDRPENLNAMNDEIMTELQEAMGLV